MPPDITYGKLNETLARVDERTLSIQKEIHHLKDDAESKEGKLLAYMNERLTAMKNDYDSLEKKMTEGYTKKESFGPVQKIVYGAVALTLSTVLGAALTYLVKK